MADDVQGSLAALQHSELTPLVAQVLDNPNIEVLHWQVQPISGGAGHRFGGGLGLYRLSGTAGEAGRVYPWTVVVKAISGANPINANPSTWNYWKREILAYRSGLLTELAGNLVAPHCYGVTEHPHDEWHIWLEDVQETSTIWTLERHGLAARHLGQFNGMYLAGQPLPAEQPWLYRGRTREWFSLCVPLVEGFQHYAHSASGRRWLSDRSVERMHTLLANQQLVLQALDRLPVCVCHHDAFRRNLLARDSVETGTQTVAVDWSMIGYGGVGEEVGITTAVSLSFMEVAADRAKELDAVIFGSYVDGLQDAGWRGDVRLARLGYTASAAIVTGVAWPIFISGALADDERHRMLEADIGHNIHDLLEQWAMVQPFLLDLGDEALHLMDELG